MTDSTKFHDNMLPRLLHLKCILQPWMNDRTNREK